MATRAGTRVASGRVVVAVASGRVAVASGSKVVASMGMCRCSMGFLAVL